MNSITLIGNLVSTPINKPTTAGDKTYTKFRIAVNQGRKDDSKTLYIDCTCFDVLATTAFTHLFKGDKVGVTGSLYCDSYTKDDVKREKWYILVRSLDFLSPKNDGKSDDGGKVSAKVGSPDVDKDGVIDDDLPF